MSMFLSMEDSRPRLSKRTGQPGAAVLHIVAALLFATSALAESSATPPQLPGKVTVIQNLNAQIPMDLMFRDETGRVVRLREYFHGKPVLLNFMYYKCPMLCSLAMDGVASSLTELKFTIGHDFDVITVSIDPRDMPKDAALKKEKYIKRYGRFEAASGWHFLTGPESAIRSLTDTVGFHYAYDIQQDQFAHPTMLAILTPEGRVSRYMYGFDYKARDVRLALVEASANKIGDATDQLLLLCYHYDPVTGKYTRSAMNIMRAGGVTTVAALLGFIFISLRRDRREAKR